MATFTIRGIHDDSHQDTKRLMESLTRAGAYFLTHAEWRCAMGDHVACLDVEAESEDEVRIMVPPVLRPLATITRVA